MLKLENVCKTYPKKRKPSIDGLSFEVGQGEMFALVGPKSAGLTTVVKVVAGITAPDSGIVTINGKNNADWPVNCRRYIGYVPETPRVYRWMDGSAWMDFISNVYGLTKEEKKEGYAKYKTAFGLDGITKKFYECRASEIQRVMLASALISEPKLLVMDEPFVVLDKEMRDVLASVCRERAQSGYSVFFTANTLAEAGLCADRIGIMCGGRLISVGTEAQLRERWSSVFEGTEMECVMEAPVWAEDR
ncbi:MAG: ABC transporter ATP-binding protein [Clostridia bacterium]|nr:ABC transporter ATP-binding protein [Clostridia bacterium]